MTLLHATPMQRGCGYRTPGGVYAECALDPAGQPLEAFLCDPPLPLPEGLDARSLANKPQVWEHPQTGVVHLLLWIGEQHYPLVPDVVEETQRFGASRKVNPRLDLARLTADSRMLLVHPRAYNASWQDQAPPESCAKTVAGHVTPVPDLSGVFALRGPCLFKLWELIPAPADPDEQARKLLPGSGRPGYLRTCGSALYPYRPTGEAADGLQPGLFAALPITGFALIKRADGSVHAQAEAQIRASGLPCYHADA